MLFDLEYGAIYTTPDGRKCAVDYLPGTGELINAIGQVRVGYLVDGEFAEFDDTEFVYVNPMHLTRHRQFDVSDQPII